MATHPELSGQEQRLSDIAAYAQDSEDGLYEFFGNGSPKLVARYSGDGVAEARGKALAELDLLASFAVLTSVEAAVRIDYTERVKAKWKDGLSKALRELHREKGLNARLEDDLLRIWQDRSKVPSSLVSDLIGAFKYRHWIAHGRYWVPKLGRRYDFQGVYVLADKFINEMNSEPKGHH